MYWMIAALVVVFGVALLGRVGVIRPPKRRPSGTPEPARPRVEPLQPVESIHASDWERGPGASLRAGLATLARDVEAAVVALADGPDLDPRAVDRVIDDWRAHGGDVVAATYNGVRLHPVLVARSVWPD